MQQTLKWFFEGLMLLIFTSCHDHDVILSPSQQHTLLIYISGDNSLSDNAGPNIRACEQGLLNAAEPLNLIIYKDNNDRKDQYPSLFRLTVSSDKSRIDTTYLMKWEEEVNSADADHLAEVITMVFTKYNSKVKGLEIWGHGRSWIPEDSWDASKSRGIVQRLPVTYAGIDNTNFLQLWDMREALDKSNIHLDYILFDACFMGTAEVAYELRNNCDWIVGSPCEILDKGFPYDMNITTLSAISGDESESANSIQSALCSCIDNYKSLYPNKGMLSLIDQTKIEALHSAYVSLLTNNASFYDGVGDNPYNYDGSMQHYGRSASGDRFHFYDLADFAKLSGNTLDKEISQAVPYYFASSEYSDSYGTLEIDHSCGLAFSPTQYFSLSKMTSALISAYSYIEWGKYVSPTE